MKTPLPHAPAGPEALPGDGDLHARHARLHRAMVDQVQRTSAAENHWLIFGVLGWEFLAACLASHYLVEREAPDSVYHGPLVGLWLAQIVIALLTAKFISGEPRFEDSPLQAYLRWLVVIFLLLSCNVAVLVVVEGQPVVVFLPFLATLSSFFFLVLAFLFARRFGLAALGMFLTGSLMARFPRYGFLLYGAAWFAALQVMAVLFFRKRPYWLATIPTAGACAADQQVPVGRRTSGAATSSPG